VTLEAGLVGRDEPTLCAFYTDVLGFALVERHEFEVGAVCRLARGDARIKIFFPVAGVDPARDADPWFRPGGWRYAALAVAELADVDALTDAAVAARGRVLLAPSNHRAGARMAMITDPEGNAWELLADRHAGEEARP
jgi:catechol 2,3-dioxygenase-like lactoylglutathione lyase family enzyme